MSSAQFAEKRDTFSLDNGEYTCSTCTPKIAVKADGADHEVTGKQDYETLAVKQVDDKTVQFYTQEGRQSCRRIRPIRYRWLGTH